MPHHPTIHRRLVRPLLVSTLAWVTGTSAMAQERNPYYVGVTQSFTRDSNVYRTDGNEIAETISSTGLVAGFDQPIGRQRLYADASAQVNRYSNVDSLNNKSYSLAAGLDWETIEFLSGGLHYNTRQSLADFGTLADPSLASDQTTQQFLATVRYGLSSKMSIDGNYERRTLDYKNSALSDRNYSQNSASAGMRWGTPDLLTFGASLRVTHGRTPEAQPATADELKRRDIDFTTTWTPSGFSSLIARISATKETHTLLTSAEVSATTGSLTWDYKPTAKLGFVASVTRDTGTETTFITNTTSPGSTPLAVDNSRLSTNAQLDTHYALTSKVALNGNVRQRKGTLANGSEDKLTGYGLGLSYAPTRSLSLNCNAARETRDASGFFTAYTVTTTSCAAQVTLR